MKIMKKYSRKLRKKINKKNINIMETNEIILRNIKEKAKEVTDMRIKRKCTYKLWDVICVVFIATLCNCNDWEEIEIFARTNKKWFKTFLKLTGGICPAVTYKNIMSTVNAEELNNFCLYAYEELIEKARKNRDMYHFDGKVDRRSGRKVNKNDEIIKNLNVLNVYSDKLEICIDQEKIDEKTNEITAIPDVIKRLNIKGVICTWDALNTQTETIKVVIEGKGDYVGALKGNQGTSYENVKDYFDENQYPELFDQDDNLYV